MLFSPVAEDSIVPEETPILFDVVSSLFKKAAVPPEAMVAAALSKIFDRGPHCKGVYYCKVDEERVLKFPVQSRGTWKAPYINILYELDSNVVAQNITALVEEFGESSVQFLQDSYRLNEPDCKELLLKDLKRKLEKAIYRPCVKPERGLLVDVSPGSGGSSATPSPAHKRQRVGGHEVTLPVASEDSVDGARCVAAIGEASQIITENPQRADALICLSRFLRDHFPSFLHTDPKTKSPRTSAAIRSTVAGAQLEAIRQHGHIQSAKDREAQMAAHSSTPAESAPSGLSTSALSAASSASSSSSSAASSSSSSSASSRSSSSPAASSSAATSSLAATS